MKQFTGGMEKRALRRTLAITLAAVIRGFICLIIFWTKSTEEGKLPIIAWQIYLLLESCSNWAKNILFVSVDFFSHQQQQLLKPQSLPHQ